MTASGKSKNSIKINTKDIAYIAMFTAIMAVCSWIAIPAAVPFTMQTFGVFLAVGVLGGKRGSLAILAYLLLGIAGVPVFAGFTGGIGRLVDTTGGYIVGFLLSALSMLALEKLMGKRKWALLVQMLIGLFVCYAFGTGWFMLVYANKTGEIGLITALTWCVIPYIIPDLIKIALALLLSGRLKKVCK